MLVGEPTLMGGELGDEDERLISRLENNQFKPSDMEETGQMYSPQNSQFVKNHSSVGGRVGSDNNLSSSNG